MWPDAPPATRLGHLHLHVGELPRALDFYHRGLGLSHMVWSYPGAAFLSAGGYHHHLGINTWAGPEAVPAGPDDARLLAWTLAVPADSVDAAAASLRAAGLAPADAPGAPGFSVADPWGTRLRVEPA
jgi:catechol 2,3-dioxygenase